MVFDCPREFEIHLENCSILELVAMAKEFKLFPEDANYLKAVNAKIKERAKQQEGQDD